MGSEWPTVRLGDLYEFSSGLSKPRSAFGSGYPFLSFKDVFHNIVVPSELSELVNSSEKEREQCSIRGGDVFLTRTSETQEELGMSSVALKSIPDATFNGFTKRLRPRTGAPIDPRYAAYYFRSPAFRRAVGSMSSLSTRASLNNEMLSRLAMVLPPLSEQQRIGSFLGALDDKIELNRRMSRTLDQLAQAMFDEWFVDYSRQLGPLLDSPIGPIPADWEVSTLGAICQKPQYGYTESASPSAVGPHFLRITDINKEPWIRWDTVPYCPCTPADTEKYGLRRGDVVIARMADPGHGAYIETDGQAVFASYLIRFRPLDECMGRYLQYWLRSRPYWELVRARQGGSTRANLNARVLADFPILVPERSLLVEFSAAADALRSRLSLAVSESARLSELRDALLPRLLSGQIAVT